MLEYIEASSLMLLSLARVTGIKLSVDRRVFEELSDLNVPIDISTAAKFEESVVGTLPA